MIARLLQIFTIVIAITGCNLEQEKPITVVVYPVAKRCAISQQDKEQDVDCTQLGTYLRETLKISASRQINVSLSGSDPTPKDDKTIDRIAEQIRATGYKDVRAYRFGL